MPVASTAPQSVIVIGAGMVGLSTAWFLQERGVDVTVIDQEGAAAGTTWGNAGWLTPGLSTPLPEPGVLRYGLRAVLSPSSPVYVPPTVNLKLLRFLLRFARNSTAHRWQRAMNALAPLNRVALESFDQLQQGGIQEPTTATERFIAAFKTEKESDSMRSDLESTRRAGQSIDYEVLTGSQIHAFEPALTPAVSAALVLKGQRFINPGAFAGSLATAVAARGGQIHFGEEVLGVLPMPGRVLAAKSAAEKLVLLANGEVICADAVVIATGTWLNELASEHGVKMRVQAGRGYSFSSPMPTLPQGPVYFPTQRVACTPIDGRLRVAGMMEFRSPQAPLDPRRLAAIIAETRPLVAGIDLSNRQDEWVGSRPCTPDGLPLVGTTKTPGVYVAGGHGMWGVTLGPATGRLLAQQITSGVVPTELKPFNPLR